MPKSFKKKPFHFSFQVFIRLVIFALVVYFLINYLSRQNSPVLGSTNTVEHSQPVLKDLTDVIIQKLPPQSQKTLQNIDQLPPIIYINDKLNYLKLQSSDFPQKQIEEVKKSVIKNILQNYLDSLDKK